jgi:hypothetical protein
MIWPFGRKQRAKSTGGSVPHFLPQELPEQTPDDPQSFGFKTIWWAFPTADTAGVVAAIELENPQPANWQTGIKYAYDRAVFVTPPVHEWTLVTGFVLMPHSDDARNEVIDPLLRLSAMFGSALVFATHRVVEYHVWAKAVGGSLVRGYGFVGASGRTFWDEGEMTPEELELGFAFFDSRSAEAENDSYWDREDLTFPREMNVMDIACKWSVSPYELDSYKPTQRRLGVVGDRSAILQHAN